MNFETRREIRGTHPREALPNMAITFEKTVPIFRILGLAKAREFYVDPLGFAVDWEHHFDEGSPAYMQVSRSELLPHLTEHHGDCCPGSTVFVRMTGIGESHRQITSKGDKFLRPGVETTFYNARCVEVNHPATSWSMS
jgi:hypothetical protein